MKVWARYACVIALLMCSACSGTAQQQVAEGDWPPTEFEVFREARAVGHDPNGFLYVVDAADSKVIILTPEGQEASTFGGTGSGDYSLFDPSDVDPTNGLDFFVADTGNSRIQRFSFDGELIESIPVPVGSTGSLRGEEVGDGRPVSVAIGPGGAMYVVEEDRGVVLKWSTNRRLTAILGGPDAEKPFSRPVDLAVMASGHVLVADAGSNSVVVIDELGHFVRAIIGQPNDQVVAVAVAESSSGQQILVIHEHQVAVHNLESGLEDVLVVSELEDVLVDATVVRGQLYALTESRLLVMNDNR